MNPPLLHISAKSLKENLSPRGFRMTHRFWWKHFHGKIRFRRKHFDRKNDLSEFSFARDSPRARAGKHRIAPFVVPEIHSENPEPKLACVFVFPSVGKGNNESCTDQFHQKIDNSLFHFTLRRVCVRIERLIGTLLALFPGRNSSPDSNLPERLMGCRLQRQHNARHYPNGTRKLFRFRTLRL